MSLGWQTVPQKNHFYYFFSAETDLRDETQFEQTPANPFNQPRQKWRRQASLPQSEHFLPSSSLNLEPQIAQVNGMMAIMLNRHNRPGLRYRRACVGELWDPRNFPAGKLFCL
jgi:hypothetical protein